MRANSSAGGNPSESFPACLSWCPLILSRLSLWQTTSLPPTGSSPAKWEISFSGFWKWGKTL